MLVPAVVLLAGLCAAAPRLTKYGSVAFTSGKPEVREQRRASLHFVRPHLASAANAPRTRRNSCIRSECMTWMNFQPTVRGSARLRFSRTYLGHADVRRSSSRA